MPSRSKASAELTIARMPAEGEGDAAPARKKPGPKPGRKKKRRRARRGGLTKSHAVAMCVEHLGRDKAPVAKVQEMLRDRFNIALKSTNVSQYKSNYLKHLREGGEVAVLAPATTQGQRAAKATSRSGDVSLDEIREIKALVGRMGADRFRTLVELILN